MISIETPQINLVAKDGWQKWKLAHAFNLIGSGTTPPTGSVEYFQREIPWVNTGDLNDGYIYSVNKFVSEKAIGDFSALKVFPKNSLIIALYGATIGKLGILQIDACTNQACCILAEPNHLDTKFVFYWLMSERNNIIELAQGGGQPNISQEIVKNLRVPAPNITTQQSIARFLDRKTAAIDTLIAKKQRLIQLLEEKRTALINQAVTKGLNPNVPMKDSGIPWIGKIPKHWEVKRLKQVTSRLAGRLVVQPHLYFSDNGVPIVFGFNISRGHIDTDNLKYMSFEADQRFARCRVSAGDLLTVRVGDPGVTAVVPEKLAGCHFASTMLIKKSSKFYSDWLCFCMNSEVIQSQIDMVNYGAAQKQFNIGDAVNFQIPFPPFEEQFLIAEKLVLILSKVDKTRKLQEKQIEKLQEYRRSLITAAVTGKLDINNLNQET